jgi:mutator protein MutT
MTHPLIDFKFCPCCGSSRFVINDERSNKCVDCGFIYYANASTAVGAIIVNGRDEMLLCKRAFEPHKGSLGLPGGFVDFDETAEQALIREIKEEIGAEVEEFAYFCTFPNIYEYSGMNIHTLDIFYICTLKDYSRLKPGDDVEDFSFIPLQKINTGEIKLNSLRRAVEKYLSEIR